MGPLYLFQQDFYRLSDRMTICFLWEPLGFACRTKKCDTTSRIVTMHSHHIIADVRKLFWADKLFYRHCGLNDSLVWTPPQNVQGYPISWSHMAFQQHTTPNQQRQTYLEVQEAQK
jgi:hypothetical protein